MQPDLDSVRRRILDALVEQPGFWDDVDANRLRRGHCDDELFVVVCQVDHLFDVISYWRTRSRMEAYWNECGPIASAGYLNCRASEEMHPRKLFVTLQITLDQAIGVWCHVLE